MSVTLRTTLASAVGTTLAAGLLLTATATGAVAQPAAASTSTASASTASVRPFTGLFHPIKNVGDNKCLEPQGGSTALFAPIVQVTCNTADVAQGWQYIRTATNHYRLENQLSGYCIWAWDGAFNGGRVLQDVCNFSNSDFNANTSLPNVVPLETRVGNKDTGYCLDVPGAAPTEGLALQIYGCNGTLAQRWVVGF
ncbi:RICIN domain-containing protein [Streptomyces sp. NPDC051976]|uniref:RICIN domain-containing protein n=1 Tax=Streptomyces sp. NPDC051976 TaxID=3154947 RepID=UPI00342DB3D8